MDETKPPFDLAKRIGQYVALRDKIKEIEDGHKEALRKPKELLQQLNGMLLGHLSDINAESARTESGTAYRTAKKSASLEDASAFQRHVIGTQSWDLLDWKANASAVETFIAENSGVTPPGVKFSQTFVVGVRRGKDS